MYVNMRLLYFIICFLASFIGAVCGIGGGVIIKPVLDAANTMDAVTVSFLSGCTVLSMSGYSVIRERLSKKQNVNVKLCLPLAAGAAVGGIIGKRALSFIVFLFHNPAKAGLIQAVGLLMITAFTFLYTLHKDNMHTKNVKSVFAGIIIGIILGFLSAFLGIGGGPINIIVLYYFYSLDTKHAVSYSLFVIFFSQLLSLSVSVVEKTVPEFESEVLLLMIIAGIAGGIVGRKLNSKIEEQAVSKMFLIAMAVIITVNIFNIYQFCK